MSSKNILLLRWGSFTLAVLLPFLAWAGFYDWQLSTLTIYQIYPLLGITAFCIMATHFIISAIRTKISIPNDNTYTKANGIIVLGLILLHPLLFYYQLFKDGYGIPPLSSVDFVGQSLAIFVFLGSFGLMLFLAYEVARHLNKKPIVKNNWFWVIISQYIAMTAIFIHAWGLGGITQNGWFKYFWLLTALSLIITAYYLIPKEWAKHRNQESNTT